MRTAKPPPAKGLLCKKKFKEKKVYYKDEEWTPATSSHRSKIVIALLIVSKPLYIDSTDSQEGTYKRSACSSSTLIIFIKSFLTICLQVVFGVYQEL